MVSHLKIGNLEFVFVWKYRYSKNPGELDRFTTWREWNLGFFFKQNKIVGQRNSNKLKEWDKNLLKQYMVGLNLLIWKVWFTVNKGKTLKLNIDG